MFKPAPRPHFTVFRVIATFGFLCAAVWMFSEGDGYSGPAYEVPDWLVGVPPRLAGLVLLLLAGVAAFAPTEMIESLIESFAGADADDGQRDEHDPGHLEGIMCVLCGKTLPYHAPDCEKRPPGDTGSGSRFL